MSNALFTALLFVWAGCAFYVVVSNIVLFIVLRARGASVSFFWAGLVFYLPIVYWLREPAIRTRNLDRFVISHLVALLGVVVLSFLVVPVLRERNDCSWIIQGHSKNTGTTSSGLVS